MSKNPNYIYELELSDGTKIEVETTGEISQAEADVLAQRVHTQAKRVEPGQDIVVGSANLGGDTIVFKRPGGKLPDKEQDVILPEAPPSAKVLDQAQSDRAASDNPILSSVLNTTQPVADLAYNITEGAGLNHAAAGIGGAIGNVAGWAVGNNPLDPLGEAKRTQERAAAYNERFDANNPNISTAANIGGFLGGMTALPVINAARGTGLGSTVVNGMVNGGLYGAGIGATNLTGEGSLDNAIEGGLVGTAGGAVLAPVFRGAGMGHEALMDSNVIYRGAANAVKSADNKLGEMVSPYLPNMLTRNMTPVRGAEQRGAEQADRDMERQLSGARMDGSGRPGTPDNMYRQTIDMQNQGVPARPADTSQSARQMLQTASTGQGPISSNVRSSLRDRQLEQRSRIQEHVEQNLGQVNNAVITSDDFVREAQRQAGPLYESAKNIPIVETPAMSEVTRTPVFPEVLRSVRFALTSDSTNMRDPRLMGFILDDAGEIVGLKPELTTEGWIEIQKAIAQMAKNNMVPTATGGLRVDTALASGLQNTARSLGDEIARQNPDYAAARQIYADEFSARNAYEAGMRGVGARGQVVEADINRTVTGDTTRDAYGAGFRSQLVNDTLTQGGLTGDAANRIRLALGQIDPNKIAQLRQIYGDDAVNTLMKQMEYEAMTSATNAAVSGNSQTSPREQAQRGVDQALDFASGNPLGIARAIINVFRHGRPSGNVEFENAYKDRIAQVLNSDDPAVIRRGLIEVKRRADVDREFAKQLEANGIRKINLGMALLASQNTDPIPFADSNGNPIVDVQVDENGIARPIYGQM